jgi:hypothetical protein
MRPVAPASMAGLNFLAMDLFVVSPLGYVKVLGHLVPREMKVQLSQSLKSMSDEELDAAIEHLRGMLAARAGDGAKVTEGNPEAVALPAPAELERCQMRRWT